MEAFDAALQAALEVDAAEGLPPKEEEHADQAEDHQRQQDEAHLGRDREGG